LSLVEVLRGFSTPKKRSTRTRLSVRVMVRCSPRAPCFRKAVPEPSGTVRFEWTDPCQKWRVARGGMRAGDMRAGRASLKFGHDAETSRRGEHERHVLALAALGVHRADGGSVVHRLVLPPAGPRRLRRRRPRRRVHFLRLRHRLRRLRAAHLPPTSAAAAATLQLPRDGCDVGVERERLQRRHLRRLTGNVYTHLSGGASWLSSKYLYRNSSPSAWAIGNDVTSTAVDAYVMTAFTTLVGTNGWRDGGGGAWAAVIFLTRKLFVLLNPTFLLILL
jgi:hypothetical protein